jgi:hypothetical protein
VSPSSVFTASSAIAQPGTWPQKPEIIAEQGELRLDSIGFVAPLRDAYRTTGLG